MRAPRADAVAVLLPAGVQAYDRAEVVAMLQACATQKAAAAQSGVSESTLGEYMRRQRIRRQIGAWQ